MRKEKEREREKRSFILQRTRREEEKLLKEENQEDFRKERRGTGIVIKVYLRNRLPFIEVCIVVPAREFRARGLQFRWFKMSKVDNIISSKITDN